MKIGNPAGQVGAEGAFVFKVARGHVAPAKKKDDCDYDVEFPKQGPAEGLSVVDHRERPEAHGRDAGRCAGTS